MRTMKWSTEELDLTASLNRSPKAGYLSIKICDNFISQTGDMEQVVCYGVEQSGDIVYGEGVVASDIRNYEGKKLLLFSISELINKEQFTEEVEELVVKVEGREVCRRKIETCPANYYG